MTTDGKERISGFGQSANFFETQGIRRPAVADSWARQSAMRDSGETRAGAASLDGLGAPLSIRAVARMLGVSPWTVRQRHLPAGLPHFRSGPQGKLIFFRDQVVAWILRQQKGGKP
jgi:hypothetical protein